MTGREGYTRIPVSEEAAADAREAKRPSETWDQYIRRCSDEGAEVREFVDADAVVDRLLAGLLVGRIGDEVDTLAADSLNTDTLTDADGEPVDIPDHMESIDLRGPAWDSDPFGDGGDA